MSKESKKQSKVQHFKVVGEVLNKEEEDFYVLNVLPVWLVLEFGFTELRRAVEVVTLVVC